MGVLAHRLAGHGERTARVGLDPVDLARTAGRSADLRSTVLGEVLVDDHLKRQPGLRELFAEPAVGGRVRDQQLGVVGCIAYRPQVVELQLPDSELPEDAGEREDLADVVRGHGHGRARRDTEVPCEAE
ncbi:hypothetical protein M3765_18055 [Streptomyces thermoviolaceus]|uniref:hypothetical protein n=1 Tax=Streptomyces thermoviolaceus TaxID=1952 RepID=UPI002041D0E5|nr:hypothetical protein [Streptomyces thermoviolaceus]MCM3265883.1 hypothetical protein [Streptomyces thermoviolaceus]